MAEESKKDQHTDQDYIELDDAIGTLLKWSRKISDALTKQGISERALRDVLDAMRRIHDGETD